MQLREMYHNTQGTIPALFLVEYASEKAFFNKFESLKPFLSPVVRREVSPTVVVRPWEAPTASVYEHSWVTTRHQWLTLDSAHVEVSASSLTPQAVQELFRGYVQELEMLALATGPEQSDLRGKAATALDFMHMVLRELKAGTGVDLLSAEGEPPTDAWVGFRPRVLWLEALHRRFWVRSFVETVEKLAKGEAATSVGEWDAAKRLGIGTLLGKLNQRALAAKDLTPERFTAIKNEFIAALRKDPKPPRPPPPILQCQADVLLDPDLPDSLPLVSSHFDLIECLPIVGLALQLKRPEGSVDNPWVVQVQSIHRGSEAVSSLSLVKTQGTDRSYRTTIDGEVFTAVLPLLGAKDRDLAPLLVTELFQCLMTFNTTLNQDAILPDAYPALLCATVAHLLELKRSDWRQETLARVYATLSAVAPLFPPLKAIVDALVAGDLDGIKGTLTDHARLLKLMVGLQLKHRQEPRPITLGTAIATLETVCEAYVRLLVATGGGLRGMLEMVFKTEDVVKVIVERATDVFPKCYTYGDLSRHVHRAVKAELQSGDHPVKLRAGRSGADGPLQSVAQVATFYSLVHPNGDPPSEEQWLRWAYRAHRTATPTASELPPADAPLPVLTALLRAAVLRDYGTEVEFRAMEVLKPAYLEWFQSTHWDVLPLSRAQVEARCAELGQPVAALQHCPETGFVKNACMAPLCPFFLKPHPKFTSHVQVWGPRLPRAFHKVVRLNRHLAPADIFALFVAGSFAGGKPLKLPDLHVSADQVLQYTAHVLEAYNIFLPAEHPTPAPPSPHSAP
eukprot:TRINITY_DN1547_c0_g1_i1.p1 TRINITY_DN1547_c0_g1~~TRINITY_DN1547_c0_g1_i1.p1  ORF type:complete len:895 (+),score=286.71 TRINITY_DN1547_c0_g1_i1:312-2687(+)